MTGSTDVPYALQRAQNHAPFLRLACAKQPELAALLAAGQWDAALQWCDNLRIKDPENIPTHNVATALRKRRLALALALAVGDLAGIISLEDAMAALSDFADEALNAALASIFAERCAGPVKGFAVLALGKHGGRELNYSSDIDPILLYDPDILPVPEGREPGKLAERIARQLVSMLGEITADGYVFRVDLRLRPASEVSPAALSLGAAISHYESQALTWEQAAFVRARAAAGDVALGQSFLDNIEGFIWRRSLDFGSIDAIHDLTRRIREYRGVGHGEIGAGWNLKTGRGGIREVEFFAQAHQLIFGGRNPALRSGNVLEALAALSGAGVIESGTADELIRNYRVLRTIEHRLQMVDDRQTHSLPNTPEKIDNVARLHGLNDGEQLLLALRPVQQSIAACHDKLVEAQGNKGGNADSADISSAIGAGGVPDGADDLHNYAKTLGFDDAAAVARHIARWRSGKARALREAPSQKALERALPKLLPAIAQTPNAVTAIIRLDDVINRLPSGLNFFRLLDARPALIDQLARILGLAAPLAEALAQRGSLLDGLLDASIFDRHDNLAVIRRDFANITQNCDYQQTLDAIRIAVSERRFALGVQLIEARHDPLDIAQDYALLAEAALACLAQATSDEFSSRYGTVAGAELIVLGLGRLGGQMLTHASDLDCIFLFTGDHDARSDGAKVLGATEYFNKLAQRVVAALSVPTASGALYEVDTRLRPSGMQGLLAVSANSFWTYQAEQAWTWEHMALCRGRAIFGSGDARADFDASHIRLLQQARAQDIVRQRALTMRQDIFAAKPAKGVLDVKLLRGGLVDLEFLVHTQQLIHGAWSSPNLRQAIRDLVHAGLLPAELAEAHDFLTRLLVAMRLIAPDAQAPGPYVAEQLAYACGRPSWSDVEAQLLMTRRHIAETWHDVFGAKIEIGA